MTDSYAYPGGELELFANAANWKTYFSRVLRPFVRGTVLEVGSGIGGTTAVLCRPEDVSRWVCLEPDESMARQTERAIAGGRLPAICSSAIGTTESLLQAPEAESFDCVLYIDVLEHIEDDRAELRRARALLRPGGNLIVLSPAHQALYTPFDAAIGHVRRYDRTMVARLSEEGTDLVLVRHLDSIGMLTSLANRLVLHSAMPTVRQILFWDRWLVPLSRVADGILGRWIGRSIVAVWRKAAPSASRP